MVRVRFAAAERSAKTPQCVCFRAAGWSAGCGAGGADGRDRGRGDLDLCDLGAGGRGQPVCLVHGVDPGGTRGPGTGEVKEREPGE